MANDTLHRMQVEIEGNDSKLKAATRDAINNIRTFVNSATSGMRSVRESMSDTGVESAKASLREFRLALKATMSDIKVASGTHVYTDDFLNMRSQIEAADQRVELLTAHLEQLKAAGQSEGDFEFDSFTEELQRSAEEANNLRMSLADLLESGGAIKFAGLGRTVANLANGFAQMGKSAGQIAVGALRRAGGAAQSLIHKLREGIPLLGKTRSGLSGIGKVDLSKGLKTILKYVFGIRSLFFLANRLRGALKDGFANLAQYSPTVNNNISTLIASLTQLKNAFAAAFAPVLNVVTPVLDFFIQKLTSAINAVGQFIAALTGQKSYIKATTVTANYAASLDAASTNADKANKATKALKRTLLGFDQIHKLDDNSDTGSDTGTGSGSQSPVTTSPKDMFTTESIQSPYADWARKVKDAWAKADFTEIGNSIGTALKNSLDNIKWNEIQNNAKKAAKSLATLVNGFISTSGLGSSIGNTIAQAINTGIYAIETGSYYLNWGDLGTFFRDTVTSTLGNINWPAAVRAAGNIGSGLASAINGALTPDKLTGITLGGNIGTAIGNAVNVALRGLKNFTGDLKWDLIGDNIKEAIINAIGRIRWDELEQTGKNVGSGIAKMLNRVMTPATFKSIGTAVAGAVKTVISGAYELIAGKDGIKWSQWGHAIASGINKFLSEMTPDDWKKAGLTLGGAIKGILETLTRAIENVHWDEVGNSIGKMLAAMDWKGILKGLGDLIWAAIKAAIEAWKGSFDAAPIETIILTGIALLTFTAPALLILTKIGKAFGGIQTGSAVVSTLASGIGAVVSKAMPAAAAVAAGVFVSNLLGDITKALNGGEFAPEGIEKWWKTPIGGDDQPYDENGNYKPGWEWLAENDKKYSSTSKQPANQKKLDMDNARTESSLASIVSQIQKWEAQYAAPTVLVGIGAGRSTPKASVEADDTSAKTKSADIPVKASIVELVDKIPTAKKIINAVKGKIEQFTEKSGVKKTFTDFVGTLGKYAEKNGIAKTFQNFTGVLAKYTEGSSIGKIFQNFTAILARYNEGAGIGKTFSNFLGILNRYSEGSGINKTFSNFAGVLNRYTEGGGINKTFSNFTARMDYMQDSIRSKLITGMTGRINYMQDYVRNGVITGITGYVSNVQKSPNIGTLILTGITAWVSSIFGNGKAGGGLYRNGRWSPIAAAAEGGTFNQGQMFIAREEGPELIGRIGSGTAVMNNNQIVASVSAGVFRAVMEAFRASDMGGKKAPVYIEFTYNVDSETQYRIVRRGEERYNGRYSIVENG